MLPVSMWLMVVHKMGTHLELSVLAFNWAGTLIQRKLLWGFQFPQIKASAVSFFQKTGKFPSTTICDVLFVYSYDSIFCVLLNCCEEKGKAILRGCWGDLLQSRSYTRALRECQSGLAATRPGDHSDTELLVWVGSRISAVPLAGWLSSRQMTARGAPPCWYGRRPRTGCSLPPPRSTPIC